MLDVVAKAIGPFTWGIPCMNIGLGAFVAVWTWRTFPLLGAQAIALLVFDMWLTSRDALFSRSDTWDETGIHQFGFFVSVFVFPIVATQALLLLSSPKMDTLWFDTAPWKIVSTQLLRLAGSCFFLLGNANLLPSIFVLHTGFLDVTMGVTAPVMAYLLYRDGVKRHRALFYVWNAVGLYDFLWVLLYITLDYSGALPGSGPSVVILGFYPLSLLAFYQVAWAFNLHVFFLVNMNRVAEQQTVLPRRSNDVKRGASKKPLSKWFLARVWHWAH